MYSETSQTKTAPKRIRIHNVASLIKWTITIMPYFGVILPFKAIENGILKIDLKRDLIYSTLLIFANIWTIIALLSNAFIKDVETNPYVVLGLCRLAFIRLSQFISILTTIKNYKKILKSLNDLIEVDSIQPLPENKLRKMTMVVTLEMLAVISGGVCYQLLALISNDDFSFWTFIQGVPPFICLVFYEATQMHFLSFMIWTKYYKNEVLQKRLKEVVGKDEISIISVKKIKHGAVLNKVEKIRCLYGRINDMKEDVNGAYAIHALLTIASIFIEMVFFVFVNITIFQYWNEIDEDVLPIVKFAQIAMWTFVQFLKLMVLVLICHSMTEKAKKTGVVLHRIYHNTKDIDVRNEISTFSIELLHRNPYVTAAGFFNVDFTLLFAMIGAVTMYIIMLIQFRFPESVKGMNPVKSLCSFV